MKSQNQCGLCDTVNTADIITSETFTITACKNCDIAFTVPPPALPDYESMDFHSKQDSDNTEKLTKLPELEYDWQHLIRTQVKLIEADFSKDCHILEIGCGEGILLEELMSRGFKNLDGFEPSRTAAIRARKRGLTIHNEYFTREKVTKKYDLILMSHVFEHIERPKDFLNDLAFALEINGAVMLTQTNYRGLIPRVLKENWYAWVPEQHYWHFTLKGLKKMFSLNGFKLISSDYCSLVHPHNRLYKIANLSNSFKDQFIAIFQKNA